MDYQFREIEQKWQKFWADKQTFKVENSSDKPKYYVLDMFPYPSGAGLHVGHPLGYIASDIFARYKRLKGFNVLHPMGYDSFGLPAEQYAIQTGQHPAVTTEANIATYRRQLDQIGFSFDWSREVRTSDASYYKWTQWIFMQLFNSWYNVENDKAEDITTLIEKFNAAGTADVKAVCDDDIRTFLPSDWATFTQQEKQIELLKYRLTYLKESTVNWCAALGTVLANDEVKDGFSERGGHPVEQKKMMQWSMRITAYADRLLKGLDTIDWPEPVKEMQRNWIGKSVGASVKFKVESLKSKGITLNPEPSTFNFIEVFTTRVDTIFGVSYLVLAPEHEWVVSLTTPEQQESVQKYITDTKKKSELDRMADTKTVSGAFTGSYAINPVNEELVPIWIADYVLAGYGTGAVMGVPSGDQRDWLFSKHFNLPIPQILSGQKDLDIQADPTKEGKYVNSGFINGMSYAEAIPFLNNWLEENDAGKAKINYRQRDAVFGRQRYWGEPIPVYFANGLPYLIKEEELPLVLPEIDKYLPTETGEPPLARAEGWAYKAPPQPSPGGMEPSDAYRAKADPAYYGNLKDNARQHRKEPTDAENVLWQFLRGDKTGVKFRRQHPVDRYIVDFISLRKGLVVEVDGKYHDSIIEEDKQRTEMLSLYNYEVIRFKNEEVIENPEGVVAQIEQKLASMHDLKVTQTEEGVARDKVLPTGEDLGGAYELSTMPGWAGSSWYWYRYMDANNNGAFADKKAIDYWQDVDLYIGGMEHATGHLLYSRFWNKFLKDLGYVNKEEPFKKLINQGMIQGRSSFVYVYRLTQYNVGGARDSEGKDNVVGFNLNLFISHELFSSFQKFTKDFSQYASLKFTKTGVYYGTNEQVQFNEENEFLEELRLLLIKHLGQFGVQEVSLYKSSFQALHVDVNMVENDVLNIDKFKKWRPEFEDSEFILENGKYICGVEVEKMSKSKFNVVNPDDLIERYGADTLRMYEMFLGPLEQSKPWNTNGIEGVFKFLRKFWRLFHNNENWDFNVSDAEPTKAESKALHKIIKKVQDDIERFSFNTSVSSFMIAVNELTDLKCNKRSILQDLVIVLSPYAPHICEELWTLLGNEKGTLSFVEYPIFNPAFLVEDEFAYPVSINGKMKMNLQLSLTLTQPEAEEILLADEQFQKYLDGKAIKKIIFVKGKIINVVV
ncbi:leucyl-tRNA synthetase [Pedobacter sp. UYP30]|uniref:leucine--tRNA ligase n=1 Tax=Pedobacter sp. UYP30 TaxID=1756400 RepID=UPI0033952255